MEARTVHKRVNYYLPADFVRRLAILAAEQETSRSQLIRRALVAQYPALAGPTTRQEAARAAS
jgi:predicted transcriptional regulator